MANVTRWTAGATLLGAVLLAVGVPGVLPGAEAEKEKSIARAKVVDAIVEGCRRIEKTQDEKGGFDLDKNWYAGIDGTRDYGWLEFKVGCTALGVLALQHAIPLLPPEEADKATKAAKKGFDFVLQKIPETKTYSAGVLLTLLYESNPQNPKQYFKWINSYATMLVLSQVPTGGSKGMWSYNLLTPQWMIDQQLVAPERIVKSPHRTGPPDNSNTQFAVLGLIFAQQAGFQVPRVVWERLREHYITTQTPDGGWGYYAGPVAKVQTYPNMTIASTVSLAICEEMLRDPAHKQCVAPPRSSPVDRGLEWLAKNGHFDGLSTYGYYSLERLGIFMGRSEIGGVDWFTVGTQALTSGRGWGADNTGNYNDPEHPTQVGAAFAVLFLARGLEPVIINKLDRKNTSDWNNDPYDVKHLTEYIAVRFQKPVQWRIVTLDASVDFLLQVPILFINGHDPVQFTDEEKAKLKEYVERGGTILAEACCAKHEFDHSFRKLLKELWPGADLVTLPRGHQVFITPKTVQGERRVLGLPMEKGQGRLGVIYLPHDLSCMWHTSSVDAKPALDLGANIYFYVVKANPPPTGVPAETPPTGKSANMPPAKVPAAPAE
jgi:hypothetical protein